MLAERREADECIELAGYEALEQPWQIRELFEDRIGDLSRRDQLTNEPSSADGLPTEFHSRYEDPLSDDVMEELRDLQRDEIMMATAYADCGRRGTLLSNEFFEAFDIVRIELETQFVAENRDRIALLLAEYKE